MRRLGYQNTVLTAIAALLALGLIDRQQGGEPLAPASAQAQEPGGLSNALEQRKVIIAELRAMNGRLDRIEGKINSGVAVNVKDMPPVKFPPEIMRRLEAGMPPAGPSPKSSITVAPETPEGR